jgi:hypothetical protein
VRRWICRAALVAGTVVLSACGVADPYSGAHVRASQTKSFPRPEETHAAAPPIHLAPTVAIDVQARGRAALGLRTLSTPY